MLIYSNPLKQRTDGSQLIRHAVWHVWLWEWNKECRMPGMHQREEHAQKHGPVLGKTSIKYLLHIFKSISPRQIKKQSAIKRNHCVNVSMWKFSFCSFFLFFFFFNVRKSPEAELSSCLLLLHTSGFDKTLLQSKS